MASIIKYDYQIPISHSQRGKDVKLGRNPTEKTDPCKGYYYSEAEVINIIKPALMLGDKKKFLKTVEMQIMDIADDIAYSVYDLERKSIRRNHLRFYCFYD